MYMHGMYVVCGICCLALSLVCCCFLIASWIEIAKCRLVTASGIHTHAYVNEPQPASQPASPVVCYVGLFGQVFAFPKHMLTGNLADAKYPIQSVTFACQKF